MNKLIFQIGVLGFCVSAVIFGADGGSLLEILSRSFLVFVGIILAAVLMLVVGGTMIENNKRQQQAQERAATEQAAQAATQRQH
jgi:hypothetical protein